MLSSLTSHLPSVIQENLNLNLRLNLNRKEKPQPLNLTKIDEVEETKPNQRKLKPANETFIIVRPPPAKNNHPLNLQVQLVPPDTRTHGLPIEDDGASELHREPSTASTSSFSTLSSTGSGRRTIVPLYNLQAHNVLTNTVVDAGTDVKIAKYTKKGLEMIDIGVLECLELWAQESAPGAITSDTDSQMQTSSEAIFKYHERKSRPLSVNKIFNRSRSALSQSSLFGREEPSQEERRISRQPTTMVNASSDSPIVMSPTLGIQPTLVSLLPFPLPHSIIAGEGPAAKHRSKPAYKDLPSRPAMYIWVIRHWLKPAFLIGPGSVFGMQVPSTNKRFLQNIDVRVEWKRTNKRVSRRGRNGSRHNSPTRRQTNRTSWNPESPSADGEPVLQRINTKRWSFSARGSANYGEEDEEEEDEVPWSCTIKVRQPYLQSPPVKLKLGILSPMPNHPKVVGMLKVPYPLPDLVFAHEGAYLQDRAGDSDSDLMLTAEEMKDLLCSTAMWIAIREGFGGVGKVDRKGDGWKIRS